MKKKLQFVSDFKPYGETSDGMQNFQQALSGLAATVHSPPYIHRNPQAQTMNIQRKSMLNLGALISGSRENLHSVDRS